MGIQHSERDPHWNYFLALEEDIGRLSRWIEFSAINESTYSIELARLLMAAAAECDVVAKRICQKVDANSRASSINAYQRVILSAYPRLAAVKVPMPRFGMMFTPWEEWQRAESPPFWWTANNKVKHHRQEHFEDANLKNVLNATAGLLLLLAISYDHVVRVIKPAPMLFVPKEYASISGSELRIVWSGE